MFLCWSSHIVKEDSIMRQIFEDIAIAIDTQVYFLVLIFF